MSDAVHPLNDLQSVKAEILSVEDNRFNPNRALTYVEMHVALQAIKSIISKTNVNNNTDNYVEYVDGIGEANLQYSLDEANKKIYVEDFDVVRDWQEGQIYVLSDSDEASKDIAVRITRITVNNGIVVIEYEEPALEELVESFNVEGRATQGGSFTPAEGITVVEGRGNRQSRASVSDTIPLWGSRTLSIDELDTEITLDMQSIEYRFVASPSWHLISIDEVYLAVNCEISADWQLEDIEIDDIRIFRSLLIDSKYMYRDAYVEYMESGKLDFYDKVPIPFIMMDNIIPMIKNAIGLDKYFCVLIDLYKDKTIYDCMAINNYIASRCNGYLSINVMLDKYDNWKSYYSSNGQFIQNIHDYTEVDCTYNKTRTKNI